MRSLLCWACCVLLLLGASAARAQDSKDAASAFAEAKRLYEQRNFAAAISAFEKAYQLRPHYLVQCSIARCYENLDKPVEAADHYRRCLSDGAAQASMGRKVQASLAKVARQITWVEVSSSSGGSVHVDGRQVGSAPTRVALNPGSHTIEVHRVGARPASTIVEARGGEERRINLEPIAQVAQRALRVASPGLVEPTTEPAAEFPGGQEQEPTQRATPRRWSSAWFWTTAALTVALAGAATGLGVATLKRRSDYEDQPTQEGYDDFVKYRLITNVCWGLTAAAAGVSTFLFFYTDVRPRREPSHESDEAGTSVNAGVMLTGTF